MANKQKTYKATAKNSIVLADAVTEYGVSRKWLRVRVKRGDIRSEKLANGWLALDRSDIERLVDDRQRVEEILAKRNPDRKGAAYK